MLRGSWACCPSCSPSGVYLSAFSLYGITNRKSTPPVISACVQSHPVDMFKLTKAVEILHPRQSAVWIVGPAVTAPVDTRSAPRVEFRRVHRRNPRVRISRIAAVIERDACAVRLCAASHNQYLLRPGGSHLLGGVGIPVAGMVLDSLALAV